MTERERLVELLCKAPLGERLFEEQYYKSTITKFADYLLVNGVIVPPCKVGDDVYVIEECRCYSSFYVERCRERQEKCNSRKYIKAVEIPAKTGTRCLKLFKRPFKREWVSKIGKSVFLNFDEAIAKIKEREEK